MDEEDRYCFYCQREVTSLYQLMKHVKREHLGVYLNLREKNIYAEAVRRLECENPF